MSPENRKKELKVNRLIRKIRGSGRRARAFVDFNEGSERCAAFIDGVRQFSGTLDGLTDFLEEKSKEKQKDSTEEIIEKWIIQSSTGKK
jgi:hypothetical protein